MVARIRHAFLASDLGEPVTRFLFADRPKLVNRGVSSVQRVLKHHPAMEQFHTVSNPKPEIEIHRLSNSGEALQIDFSVLQAILQGVPRSYPFGAVAIHLHAPAFGEALRGLPKSGDSLPGVLITDNWWIKGRQRALSIYTVVEASASDQKLPPDPEPVARLLKACGKPRKTIQIPTLAPGGGLTVSIPAENIRAVNQVVADFRVRTRELVERAAMPHDLPPPAAIPPETVGLPAGPRKPALDAAFKPMGYACCGGSGEFHLTRRTAGNLIAEVFLDVGTWSHDVSASFLVKGAGFKASLGIPVLPGDFPSRQYPIGDAGQWRKIVENLAAMVRELERSFVPAVERAAGPSPAWHEPSV